jgi:hypothetical protein
LSNLAPDSLLIGLSSGAGGDFGRDEDMGSVLERMFDTDMTLRLGVLVEGPAALMDDGGGDSVRPRGGRAEEEATTGESILRTLLLTGLMDPAAAG